MTQPVSAPSYYHSAVRTFALTTLVLVWCSLSQSICQGTTVGSITMALNIPGVIMMVVFYVLILVTGMWGARKSRKAERMSAGDRTEVVLLGDRRISLVVGIFTMTGMLVGAAQKTIHLSSSSSLYSEEMALYFFFVVAVVFC